MTQDEVISSLPEHLRPFVAIQDYARYTPRDQAVWRFLLHELKNNLSQSAHPVYLEGLRQTGISLEHIPRIEYMNECLSQFEWRAVVVNGFIPPIVFMEFQALKVLPIATEIRSIEHMLYTPAPDIVHEAAGHAPFIVDEDYAEFLQRFGQLGMRAVATRHDQQLYEAIRQLSIIKESPTASETERKEAEQQLDAAMAANTSPSEAALLARLHWWTIEYGLVGTPQHYQIFGAGLLSSLGESVNCLDDQQVIKHPLTVNAVATAYDITCEQPQLFVARNCRHLSQVLEEFGRQMCVNRGGKYALQKAIEAGTVNTAVTNAGLEISGHFSNLYQDAIGNVTYIATSGPTQLAIDGAQLDHHGIDYHHAGFSSPLGRLQGLQRSLCDYSIDELKELGIAAGSTIELNFLSGIQVTGQLQKILRRQQKNLLFTIDQCQVIDLDGKPLFQPEWGLYDMAVGDEIVSVYGGSADPVYFPLFKPAETTSPAPGYDSNTQSLFACYDAVRELRQTLEKDLPQLNDLIGRSKALQQPEWLLYFELLELALQMGASQQQRDLQQQLQQLASAGDPEQHQLIDYGFKRLAIDINRQAG